MRNKTRSDCIDITGKRFGPFTVLKKAGKTTSGSKWICQCDCGNIKTIISSNLRRGLKYGCGCLRKKTEEEYFEIIKNRLLEKSAWIGECREWISKHKCPFGYGFISFYGKLKRSHRVAWTVWKGPIPKGMWVLHKCDNPKCINIEHLFLGNRQDNIDDMMKKNRNRHLKGEENGTSKLHENDVLEIRKLLKNDSPNISQIARKYSVSRHCIKCIGRGITWKHLADPQLSTQTIHNGIIAIHNQMSKKGNNGKKI